jgi:hypothetical protein
MVNRSIFYTVALFAASAITALAGPVTLADLNSNFSAPTGSNGWSYGFYTTPFNPTTFSTTGVAGSGYNYTIATAPNFQIEEDGGQVHFAANAGDTPTADASTVTIPVARWTDSSYTGSITISGFYYKVEATTGSYIPTVTPTIYVGNTSVYSANLVPGTTTSTPYSFTTTVAAGQTIDFVLGLPIVPSPGGGSPAYYDYNGYTAFEGAVTTATPEPASWTLLGLGGLFFLAGARRLKAVRS